MPDYPRYTSNVPPGGDKGQVLMKESDISYDVGWHDAGIEVTESTVEKVIDDKLSDLNGKPNQVLGFDDKGDLKPIDIPDSGGGECSCPPIATDEEINEMLDEIFK